MVDERLPASTSYNPIYDVQGDIIGLLNTSGELKQAVRYGPYGDNATASGSVSYSATNDPFLFQGGYHLAGGDTGAGNIPNDLYHYGERYYDPTNWKVDPARPGGRRIFVRRRRPSQQHGHVRRMSDRSIACTRKWFSRGDYFYIQVCGTRGKRTGKLIGYVRLTIPQESHKERQECFESRYLAGPPVFCEGPGGELNEEILLPGANPVRGMPVWDPRGWPELQLFTPVSAEGVG